MLLILGLVAVAAFGALIYMRKKAREDSKMLPGMSKADLRRFEKMKRKDPIGSAKLDDEVAELMAEVDANRQNKKS